MERLASTLLHRYRQNLVKYASLLNHGNTHKTKRHYENRGKESFSLKRMDLSEIK